MLKPEEAALFDDVSWDEPEPVIPVAVVAEAPKPDLVPPPKPKADPLIMPDCKDCGTALNPDNASKLRGDNKWKHLGCPKTASETKKPPPVGPAPAALDITEAAKKIERVTAAAVGVSIPLDISARATSTPAPIQGATTVTYVYELGPQTLAALKALLGK